MSVNMSKSMNSELLEGATDGTVKKLRPDTDTVGDGGDNETAATRSLLNGGINGYGRTDGSSVEATVVQGLLRNR